jgi:hypothetical protein
MSDKPGPQEPMLTQRDFGPLTIGNLGDAWLAAAAFERERLQRIASPTSQSGMSTEVRRLGRETCEANIMVYEERAQAHFKVARLGLEEIAA